MKKIITVGILLIMTMVFLSGCVQQQENLCADDEEAVVTCVKTGANNDNIIIIDENDSVIENTGDNGSDITTTTVSQVTTTTIEMKADTTKEYNEGDLISFKNLKVEDPDGDDVKITFSKPLNEEGEWQTKKGDAGEYFTTISASDGKDVTSMVVKLIVKSVNSKPVIEVADEIEVKEGDIIKLNPKISDPDGDKVVITYAGFMNSDTYQTSMDDAGEYSVTIIASDGKVDVTKTVKIVVKNVNNPPELSIEDMEINAAEGDLIKIKATATDKDGDDVQIMFEDPFDENGEWQTAKGDAGTKEVSVTATDGYETVSKKVKVIVNKANNAPIIEIQDEFTVTEGDTVKLVPTVSDPDGDEVTISYSGWMQSSEYKTQYDDQGEHNVKITATDGKDSAEKIVKIIVEDENRAPEFLI